MSGRGEGKHRHAVLPDALPGGDRRAHQPAGPRRQRALSAGAVLCCSCLGHGLDPTTLFDIHVLLYSHVQSLAVHLEMEAHAEAATGRSEDQWMDSRAPALRELVESGRFPTFTKVVGAFKEDGYNLRLDALFEFGLKALLDGLTSIIEGQETVA